MRKILSLVAVSTLVGTSATDLKPWITTLLVNIGFKSIQFNNKDIIIKNENNSNPFDIQKLNLW